MYLANSSQQPFYKVLSGKKGWYRHFGEEQYLFPLREIGDSPDIQHTA
jgi:hypothetical protein